MIELIVYPKPEDKRLINNSPFCSKTEIFLKLAKLEYKVTSFQGDPGKFAKGKLPAVKIKGKLVEDSSFIQKYLEKEFSLSMDAWLSDSEKAQGFAFVKMLENYLYWSILHERWLVDENWEKLRDGYFGAIPKFIRGFVTGKIRKKVRAAAVGHGMSRHSDSDIFDLGCECVKAVSDFLGSKDFILGDKVSSYDSSVYGFMACLIHSPYGNVIKDYTVKNHSNILDYDKRMFNLMDF